MTRRRRQLHLTPAAAARQREASAAALVAEAAEEAERTGDLSRLRKVAAVRGLATDALRARLWPLLAGVPPSPGASPAAIAAAAAAPLLADAADDNANNSHSGGGGRTPSPSAARPSDDGSPELWTYLSAAASARAKGHRDALVVACDVERSLWRLCGDGERPARRAALARVLGALLATEGGEEGEATAGGRGAANGAQEQQQGEAGRDGGAPQPSAAEAAANGDDGPRVRPAPRPSSSSPAKDDAAATKEPPPDGDDGPVRYYQGLHDVASVLVVVLRGDELAAYRVLRRLSRCHLRDATRPSLDAVVELLTRLLPPLVRAADPELATALERAAVPPFYALSWALTWFAHGARDARGAARLFDLFLSSHPSMPLYVGAAAMRANRAALLRAAREGEAEGEAMPRLHTALVNMDALAAGGGGGAERADRLACEALELFSRLPPEAALAADAARAAADSAAAGRGKGSRGAVLPPRAWPPPRAARLRLAVTPRAYLSAPGGAWRVPPPQDGAGGGGGGGGGRGGGGGEGGGGAAALLGAWTARQVEAFLDAVARLAAPAPQQQQQQPMEQQKHKQKQQLALRRRPGAAASEDGRAFAALLPALLRPLPPALRPVAAYAMSGFVLLAAVLAGLGGRGAAVALGGMRF